MADYKKMYLDLFATIQHSIEHMQDAQLRTEKEYIEGIEPIIELTENATDSYAGFPRAMLSSDSVVIGRNIKELRIREGVTVEQITKVLNVSASKLSAMECGEEEISLDGLCRLSNFFCVSVDSLLMLGSTDNENKSSNLIIFPGSVNA